MTRSSSLLQSVPPETQQLLLTAAVEPVAVVTLLRRRIEPQIRPASAVPCVTAGSCRQAISLRMPDPGTMVGIERRGR